MALLFLKRDNFCDILFVTLEDETSEFNIKDLLKEMKAHRGPNSFVFRVTNLFLTVRDGLGIG